MSSKAVASMSNKDTLSLSSLQRMNSSQHDRYSHHHEKDNDNLTIMSAPPTVARQRSAPVTMQKSSSSQLSKTTSISKHYALNQQILNAFDSLYLQNKYRVAYAIGIQFVETALLEIPKHGYFYSSRHKEERLESSQEAIRVTKMLEVMLQQEPHQIVEKMEREEKELQRIAKLRRLAQEQHEQALSLQQYEEDRRSVEQDVLLDHDYTTSLCGSLWEYSDSLSAAICPPKRRNEDEGIPPKIPVKKTTSELELEQALFLSGLQVKKPTTDTKTTTNRSVAAVELMPAATTTATIASLPPPSQPLTPKKDGEADILSTSRTCFEEFSKLCNAQRIRISRIDTYQGRVEGSINGCTVIAPLLCIHHFYNHDAENEVDLGLPDEAIRQVIDVETPVVLPQVRQLLGLTKDALIIPSDVHDFLLERQLLTQEQFVTVMGGNILDPNHVQAFVDALCDSQPFVGKRMAATLFFQEHVVAIHKLNRGGEQQIVVDGKKKKQKPVLWFDFIDSLPFEETLSKNPFQHHDESSSYYEEDDVYSSTSRSEQREGPEELSSRDVSMSSSRHMSSHLSLSSSFSVDHPPPHHFTYIPNAARIRCVDQESLKATLKWFACSKFTPENKSYIDAYAWDDRNSDFDPRVFQAFVWAGA